MRRSFRRETERAFGWMPYWWGNRWAKRRLAKLVRKMREARDDG